MRRMLVVMLACAATAAASPIWPMYRGGPQRTGRSPFKGPTHLRVRWAVDLKHEIAASPAITADGTIYVGAGPILYALSPEGKILWSHDFVASGHSKEHSENFTSPSPALGPDGTIYQPGGLGGKGFVMALDPKLDAAPRMRWAYVTRHEMRSSPLVLGETVYTGCRLRRMILPLTFEGKKLWGDGRSSLLNITSSPAASADGSTLYIGGFDGKLHAFAAATGKELWSVGRRDDARIRLPKWNREGRVTQHFTTAGHVPEAPAVGEDGTIYFGSWDGRLYAASAEGKQLWAIDLGDRVTSAPALAADGRVLVVTYEGRLVCVRCIDGKAVVDWSAHTGGRYSSPLISSDGKVYTGTLDGRLLAFALADGAKLAELKLEGWIYPSPVLGDDGVLYVGCSDGFFRAVE